MVKSFNSFFQTNGIQALAYRLKQSRFAPQYCDINVDSKDSWYMAIECKSISTEKGANALYFSQHFSVDKNKVHQLDRFSKYLESTGRCGLVAVELRQGVGRQKQAYLIPFSAVMQPFHAGVSKIPVDEIKNYTELRRSGGLYQIKDMIE